MREGELVNLLRLGGIASVLGAGLLLASGSGEDRARNRPVALALGLAAPVFFVLAGRAAHKG